MEVLISMLVLSIGLLGMSALHVRALKGNASSGQRSQAVIFAQYMLDVMRVDREMAKGGSYNTAKTCNAAAFSGSTLADQSRAEWITSVKAAMGNTPQTCVEIDCKSTYECRVGIYWDDSRAAGKSNAEQSAAQVQKIEVTSRV